MQGRLPRWNAFGYYAVPLVRLRADASAAPRPPSHILNWSRGRAEKSGILYVAHYTAECALADADLPNGSWRHTPGLSADGLVGARRELCRVKVEVLNRRGRRRLILNSFVCVGKTCPRAAKTINKSVPCVPRVPCGKTKAPSPDGAAAPRGAPCPPRAPRDACWVLAPTLFLPDTPENCPASPHVFLDEIRPDVTNAECARCASGSAARTVCNNRRVPPRRFDTSRGAG